jgi:AcrR family transcriptional regulator
MEETGRQTAKAHRRQRYLLAAARLFAARGFDRVSIDDLGAEAGVSGPALYRHFSGKDAILVALLEEASERLLDGARSVVADSAAPEAVLAALVSFHAAFAVSERDVIRVQDRELDRLPPEDNRRIRSLQRRYVDLWAEQLRVVLPAAADAEIEVRLHGVFGLLNSTPHHPLAAEVPEVRELLTATAFAALIAARPAAATTAGDRGGRESPR